LKYLLSSEKSEEKGKEVDYDCEFTRYYQRRKVEWMSGKKDKRSAILVNPLKLEINLSSLIIICELWGE